MTSKYAIRVRYYFYTGTYITKRNGHLHEFADNSGAGILVSDSKESAEKYLWDSMMNPYRDKSGRKRFQPVGTYYLSPGEYARPDYTVVKLRK